MKRVVLTLTLSLAPLLCPGALAQTPGTTDAARVLDPTQRLLPDTGLVSAYTLIDCGAGFIQASRTTRTIGPAACPLPQDCPFLLSMPALPPGAVPFVDVVVFNFLADTAPANHTIFINGVPVPVPLVGSGTPDLCWGRNNGLAYARLLTPGIVNYGAPNTIELVCDAELVGDSGSLGSGITIVTVYGNNTASGPVRIVDVAWGYSSTQSSGTGTALANVALTCGYGGGPARVLVNAIDGQIFDDRFWINGVDVSGVFPGTSGPTDAWIGLAGPCPSDNLYDVGDGNAEAWMSPGDTSIRLEHVEVVDCLGMSLAVVQHTAYDTSCFGCATARYCRPPNSPNNLAGITIEHCIVSLTCDNNVLLTDGPPGQFTYLLIGQSNGIVVNPPGAIGDLCVVGGCISRFIADAGAIGPNGVFATNIANSASGGAYGLPATCGGTIDSGEVWSLQYWHRDGMNPARFSEAIQVVFQ